MKSQSITLERHMISSGLIEVGQVEVIFRNPVKSLGGERLEVTNLGWYGLEGDRRLAFRRIDDRNGFPWLTANKLPDLLLFAPHERCQPLASRNYHSRLILALCLQTT